MNDGAVKCGIAGAGVGVKGCTTDMGGGDDDGGCDVGVGGWRRRMDCRRRGDEAACGRLVDGGVFAGAVKCGTAGAMECVKAKAIG